MKRLNEETAESMNEPFNEWKNETKVHARARVCDRPITIANFNYHLLRDIKLERASCQLCSSISEMPLPPRLWQSARRCMEFITNCLPVSYNTSSFFLLLLLLLLLLKSTNKWRKAFWMRDSNTMKISSISSGILETLIRSNSNSNSNLSSQTFSTFLPSGEETHSSDMDSVRFCIEPLLSPRDG